MVAWDGPNTKGAVFGDNTGCIFTSSKEEDACKIEYYIFHSLIERKVKKSAVRPSFDRVVVDNTIHAVACAVCTVSV